MMTDEMLTKLAVNERSLSAALITFGGRCCCCSGGGGIGGSSAMLDLWLELFMSYTNIYIYIGEKSFGFEEKEREIERMVEVVAAVGSPLALMLCSILQ